MNDYMAQQMDDEIQRGIELRDSIDEYIQSFGWLPEESIPLCISSSICCAM